MSLVPDYKGLRDLISRTSVMVRDFLLEEVYHDATPQELASDWETTVHQVLNLTESEEMSAVDLLTLLDFSALDFGITIRDPGSGKEVTFFAAENLGQGDDMEIVTEEVIDYQKQGKKSHEGINFLPQIHKVDGRYNLSEEEDLPRNPFESDPSLDEDLDLCENCGDHAPLPDSLLCYYCLEAGVEASPPEHLLPDVNGSEILATVHSRAEMARRKSLDLLEMAGLLDDPEALEEDEDEEEKSYFEKAPRGAEEEEEGGEYLHIGQEEDRYAPEVRQFFDFGEEE